MTAVLVIAAPFAGVLSSCGTDPVGVDDCRAIETARCDAAIHCGTVEDAEACRRFYRDHCLHGLAAPDTPGGPQVDACTRAIKAAGQCASVDPEQSVLDCDADADITPISRSAVGTVCDVVDRPELIRQCEFLSKQPDDAAGGAGGESGD